MGLYTIFWHFPKALYLFEKGCPSLWLMWSSSKSRPVHTYLGESHMWELFHLQNILFSRLPSQLSLVYTSCCNCGHAHSWNKEQTSLMYYCSSIHFDMLSICKLVTITGAQLLISNWLFNEKGFLALRAHSRWPEMLNTEPIFPHCAASHPGALSQWEQGT